MHLKRSHKISLCVIAFVIGLLCLYPGHVSSTAVSGETVPPPIGSDRDTQSACILKSVLFVAGTRPLQSDDLLLAAYLTSAGWIVVPRDHYEVEASEANGKDLVIISKTVSATIIGDRFRDVSVPVLTWESWIFADMKMTGSGVFEDYGVIHDAITLSIASSAHPMAGGLVGTVKVHNAPSQIHWGKPSANAFNIAVDLTNSDYSAIFGYEKGATMVGMTAPARRVGLFNGNVSNMTEDGQTLVIAAILWAAGCTDDPPATPTATATETETPLPPKETATPTATDTPPLPTPTATPTATTTGTQTPQSTPTASATATATTTASPTASPTATATATTTATQTVAPPSLLAVLDDTLTVDTNSDGIASPGDMIQYQVTIRNQGGETATDIKFSMAAHAYAGLAVGTVQISQGTVQTGNQSGDTGVSVDVGVLAPGATATVRYDVRVNEQLPPAATQIEAQGIVSSRELPTVLTDDPDTKAENDPTITPLTTEPILSVTQRDALFADEDANGRPSPGDILQYEVTVRNSGNDTATNVRYQGTVDPYTSLITGTIRISTAQGERTATPVTPRAADSLQITLGDLPGNNSALLLRFQVRIANPLPANVVSVQSRGIVASDELANIPTDDPDTTGADDPTITQLDVAPRLRSSKVDFLLVDADGDNEPSPGDTLLYLIKIVNIGNAAATGIRLRDTPDVNTPLQIGSVRADGGTVVAGNKVGDDDVLVDFGAIEGADHSVTVSLQTTIAQGFTGRAVQNQATIQYNGKINGEDALVTVLSDDPDTGEPEDSTTTPIPGNTVDGAGARTNFLPLIRR